MTDVTAAFREVLLDIHSDPASVMEKASFLDDAMPTITTTLTQTYEAVSPMIAVIHTLQGLPEEEIHAKVRENALQGSFALGLLIGIEFQKRGYVPAPNPDLDRA